LSSEVIEILTTKIGKFAMFEVMPDALIGVEVRGIGGQSFEMDTLGSAIRQKLFNGLAAMNRCAIPNDQELAFDLGQSLLEEGDHSLAVKRLRLDRQVQATIGCNGTDERKMVVGQRAAQYRRLADRRPSPAHARQQVEARFV
jgi:hypothetical protein